MDAIELSSSRHRAERMHASRTAMPRWIALLLLLFATLYAADSLGYETGAAIARSPRDYAQYAIGLLIAVQAIWIIALVTQERRRKHASIDTDKYYADMTHAARLALAGEITASITHEVTQPLSAILSNVETAELLLAAPQPDIRTVREILSDIRHDDLRANEIVRRLRTLLRKRELQFESVDINSMASNALALVVPDALRRNIVIRTALAPGLPRVSADPVHLQQVLLNLIINSMDAMHSTPAPGRSLQLRTARDDDHVQVSVIDSGQGMTPEQIDHAFDSFFTTKPDGMGLGLSIARTIIQAHGGAIWAENRPSGGTAFLFTIPVRAL